MTKTEALAVLSKLPPMQKVRLIIDLPATKVDSNQCADYHIYWLMKEFCSPKEGYEFGAKETDCVQLESSSFDFALAYNSVIGKVETPETVEYTQEQKEQMWALHYETNQQNHVGYFATSKGE